MPARRQINRYATNSYINNHRYYHITAPSHGYTGEPMIKQSAKKAAMRYDTQLPVKTDIRLEEYQVEKHNGRYIIVKL